MTEWGIGLDGFGRDDRVSGVGGRVYERGGRVRRVGLGGRVFRAACRL